MGSLFKRGETWWIQYYQHGKRHRESSKTTSKMVAKAFLAMREGEIVEGKIPSLLYEKTKFEHLKKLILDDYTLNQRKSIDRVQYSLKHLDAFFCGYSVTEITSDSTNQYILNRVNEGAANATLNRELACLKRMLNLGLKYGKVGTVPKITLLKEKNVRKGFFEHDDFLAIRAALPEYLKGFVTFGYKIGWRVDDIVNLTWAHVNRKEWYVRVEGDIPKNEEPITIYLDEELKEVFGLQWAGRKKGKKIIQYVFPNFEGTEKIGDFRGAWKSACKETGVNRLFHDFRRTAVRNYSRAGVPDVVAMLITGHKTRSVYDRYNIVNQEDLKNAAASLEKHQNSDDSHNLATIHRINKKRVS
jgi:integrase